MGTCNAQDSCKALPIIVLPGSLNDGWMDGLMILVQRARDPPHELQHVLQETVWEKIQKNREAARAANKPFADNRTFSSQVRDLVKRGKADEARQLCAEQVWGPLRAFDMDYLGTHDKLNCQRSCCAPGMQQTPEQLHNLQWPLPPVPLHSYYLCVL